MNYILMFSGVSHSKPHFCKIYLQQLGFKNRLLPRFTKHEIKYNYYGPVGSNHSSLQQPPLLALGHRATGFAAVYGTGIGREGRI